MQHRHVRDADMDDAVGSAGPQPTDQNIPSVFASLLMKVVLDWAIWVQVLHRLSGATGIDMGFVVNR
jgi:hypothetical protein